MSAWHLRQSFETSAGRVAAGTAGTGPALVLAHGWPWSSYAWHRVIPGLAEHFTVHWYDMPGYGRSDQSPEHATSLDVQGAVFAEMLDRWGLDRPAVVAHDFGGAATLRAHLLHSRDFDRYVLMNVVAMRPWGSDFFEHVERHVDAFTGLPPHIHAAVAGAYIRSALVTDLPPEDVDGLIEPWLSDAGRASFYRQFAQADERYTAEVEPAYGDVRCPVRILWGRDDPWIPLARGEALHTLMPHAGFEVLDGLGHLPQLEDPLRVLDSLLAFLTAD